MQTATVTSIEYLTDDEYVYDITVEDDHSYLMANGIMSHNSAMAMNVGLHQASIGAKVLLLSLEMKRTIVVRRILAYLTGIPLSRINRAHEMDRETRAVLIRAWREYHDRVRRNGGRFRIVYPPEDISMEEMLTIYKPYGYDNHIIDYLGLMKDLDGDDQWRRMGAAVRQAVRFAGATDSIITILAQLSAEGLVRYARSILEHAHLAWTWQYVDAEAKEARILTIRQPKTRNLKSFDFMVEERFDIMRIQDLEPTTAKQYAEQQRANQSGKRGKRQAGGGVAAGEASRPRGNFVDQTPVFKM